MEQGIRQSWSALAVDVVDKVGDGFFLIILRSELSDIETALSFATSNFILSLTGGEEQCVVGSV